MILFSFSILAAADPNVDAGVGAGAFGLTLGCLLVSIAAGVLFYLLPTFIAMTRRHPNTASIAILNIFLGWTFIGYIVALVWAFSAITKHGNISVNVYNDQSRGSGKDDFDFN